MKYKFKVDDLVRSKVNSRHGLKVGDIGRVLEEDTMPWVYFESVGDKYPMWESEMELVVKKKPKFTKFNVGDIVTRTKGRHGGMKVGDIARVINVKHVFGGTDIRYNLAGETVDSTFGHDADNLRLAKVNPYDLKKGTVIKVTDCPSTPELNGKIGTFMLDGIVLIENGLLKLDINTNTMFTVITPAPIEVSLKEIASWKGVDVSQLKIVA